MGVCLVDGNDVIYELEAGEGEKNRHGTRGIDMNEDTFPILALAAVAFIMVMSITFGAAIYSNVSTEANTSAVTDEAVQAQSTVNMWVISIASIILIMIMIIGFQKFKGK